MSPSYLLGLVDLYRVLDEFTEQVLVVAEDLQCSRGVGVHRAATELEAQAAVSSVE